MMSWPIILIVILVLLAIGGLPNWGYMSGYNYGYAPTGLFGLIVLVLIILLLMGRL
jgi:Sec-independent protein translocase protein TatA